MDHYSATEQLKIQEEHIAFVEQLTVATVPRLTLAESEDSEPIQIDIESPEALEAFKAVLLAGLHKVAAQLREELA